MANVLTKQYLNFKKLHLYMFRKLKIELQRQLEMKLEQTNELKSLIAKIWVKLTN